MVLKGTRSGGVIRELTHLVGDVIGVVPKLHADGYVRARGHRHHNLVEVAVADDDLAQAAAVELAALSGDREQRRI